MKTRAATARGSVKYWATGTLQPTLPVVLGPSAGQQLGEACCGVQTVRRVGGSPGPAPGAVPGGWARSAPQAGPPRTTLPVSGAARHWAGGQSGMLHLANPALPQATPPGALLAGAGRRPARGPTGTGTDT